MEVSVSDLLKSAFDGLLDGKNENSRADWKFLFRAAEIIDKKENEWRSHDR